MISALFYVFAAVGVDTFGGKVDTIMSKYIILKNP